MLSCPDKNHPDFKKLVEDKGLNRAYYEWNKLYNPDWGTTQKQVDTPWRAKTRLENKYNAEKGKFIPLNPSKKKNTLDDGTLQNLRRDVNSINVNFDTHIIKIKLTSDSRSAQLKVVPREESESVTDEDTTIVNSFERNVNYYNGDEALRDQEEGYSQKYSNASTTTVDEVRDQIEFLKNNFNAEVIEDTSIEDSGQLLPKSHELTKKYGKPVILINPDKLFTDTVIHEFGHLYIDLLGGLSNSRINAAVEYLKDTDLWNRVDNIYSEEQLSDEMLAKEVLATALGLEGSKIFNNQSKIGWWNRFVDWFFNLLGIRVGQQSNILKDLTKDLVSNQMHSYQGELSDTVQKRKIDKKLDKEIKTTEELVEKLEKTISKKLQKQKMYNFRSDKVPSEEGKQYQGELETFLKELRELKGKDDKLAMLKFAAYISSNSTYIKNKLREREKEGRISDEFLNNVDSYFRSFEDIANTAKKILGDDIEIEEAFDNAKRDLNSLKDIRDKLIDSTVAELFAKNSNFQFAVFRERYNTEANKLGLKGEEKERYTIDKLSENEEEIYKAELEFWKQKFSEASFDVKTARAWLFDPKRINSGITQVTSKMIDIADQATSNATVLQRDKMIKAFDKYRKSNKGLSQEKLYGNILQQDSEGNYYLISEYNAEFFRKYDSLKREEYRTLGEFGENSKEFKNSERAFREFKKNNLSKGKPTNRWKNPNFNKLSSSELEFLSFLENFNRRSQGGLSSGESLLKEVAGTNFYQLPSITKSQYEKITEGRLKDAITNPFKEATKKQVDDTEFREVLKDDTLKVRGDESNYEVPGVPVRYRRKTDPKDQSLDLPSIFLLDFHNTENYRQKTKIAPSLELASEAVARKLYIDTVGMSNKAKVNLNDPNSTIKKKGISNEFVALRSTMENRLYGIREEDVGEFLGMDVNKVTNALSSYTGTLMLAFNLPAAVTNVFNGKLQQMIESVDSPFLSFKSYKDAEQELMKDWPNILTEVGTINQNSKTMQMLEKFRGLSDFKVLYNRFAKDSRLKALLETGSLHFMNHGGEFYMQATLMYAILGNIKAMNDTKQYIDKNGNIVSKKKAMSLLEAYQMDKKTNKVKLNSNVVYNSFDFRNKMNTLEGNVSLTNLIGNIRYDLFGQYDDEMKSLAQRQWWGKLTMMFKKWILRMFDRRYKHASTIGKSQEEIMSSDATFNQDTMTFEEGMYVSSIRFVKTYLMSLKELGFGLEAYKESWNSLTDHQKANIHKSVVELGLIGLTGLLAALFKNIGEDEDDEDYQTRIYYGAFLTKRLYSELSFFINPYEAIRLTSDPMVATSTIQNMFELFEQGFSDLFSEEFEEYETGVRRGKTKIGKDVKDLVPLVKFYDYKVREKMNWYFN